MVWYASLLHSFSIWPYFFSNKDDLEWFWQRALCKSIQLMLAFIHGKVMLLS